MAETFVLSNFDTHIFLGSTAATSTAASPGDELHQCTNANLGKINKDVKRTKELDGLGWDTFTMLGQAVDDITLEFNRKAEGVYEGSGTTGTDSYTVLKKWFDGSIENPVGATKYLTHIRRRLSGTSVAYEGMQYCVIPINWADADANGDDGQSFSVTLGVIGAPVPVDVTATGTAPNTTFTVDTAFT